MHAGRERITIAPVDKTGRACRTNVCTSPHDGNDCTMLPTTSRTYHQQTRFPKITFSPYIKNTRKHLSYYILSLLLYAPCTIHSKSQMHTARSAALHDVACLLSRPCPTKQTKCSRKDYQGTRIIVSPLNNIDFAHKHKFHRSQIPTAMTEASNPPDIGASRAQSIHG